MHYNIECFFNNMQYDVDLQKGDDFALSLMDVDDGGDEHKGDDGDNGGDDGNGGDGGGDGNSVDDGNGNGGDDDGNEDCVIFAPTVDDGSKEFEYFKNFVKEIVMVEELEPYRTEMLVYDEDVKITGSIDMLYRKKNGEFAIFDWKRSKEISYEGFRGKKSPIHCIKHLDDSNYWHYSLQLNIYRRILQKNYGLTVSDLRLVILHPDHNDYMCLVVPFLDKEIDALFEMRENELKVIQDNDIKIGGDH